MIWLALIASVLFTVLAGAAYLVFSLAKLGFVDKASGGKRWLARLISLAIIAAAFLIVTAALSLVDAAIVFIHVLVFFLLSGLVLKIADRAGQASSRAGQAGIRWALALLASVLYLAVGYYQCVTVWQTNYEITSTKVQSPLRIALIADSHLGTTFDGEGFAAHLDEIMSKNPDYLMIAGDFVDDGTNKKDLARACEALKEAKPKYGIWFVYGNHDKGYFRGRDFTAAELDSMLRSSGVNVMEDEVAHAGALAIVGRKDGMTTSRLGIQELISAADTSKFTVVLNHEPTDYENEELTAADLVLSGHTHGGQIMPLGFLQVALGINDSAYGHVVRNGTNFIVTSGIADWEMHFKTGTKSEYVIIDVNPT